MLSKLALFHLYPYLTPNFPFNLKLILFVIYCGNEFATNPPKFSTLKTEKNLKTLKLLPVYNSNITVGYTLCNKTTI